MTDVTTSIARTSRGKSVHVDDHIQALVLKKALLKYKDELEDSATESDALVTNADIIMATEDLLDSVNSLTFFNKSEPVKRVTKASTVAKTSKAVTKGADSHV